MTVLRITAGTLRGRKVSVPPHDLRPTSVRARQAYFDILGHHVQGAVFLDLFCGSGIFTLEALSRGARKAIAIDNEPRAIRHVEKVAHEWDLAITVVRGDAIERVAFLDDREPIDVVFADPPWDFPRYRNLAEAIDRSAALAETAIIGIEHRSRTAPFEGASLSRISLRKTARYGDVSISIFDVGASHGQEDETTR